MRDQNFSQYIAVPPNAVYRALLDPCLIGQWRAPSGMHATVHEFDARPGGRFRVSLTYESTNRTGKSSAHTDTYHGTFRELIPEARVVETIEFETADPALQGEMRITTTLTPVDGGTQLMATHEGLPRGVLPSDNALGWRESLGKLVRLIETSQAS